MLSGEYFLSSFLGSVPKSYRNQRKNHRNFLALHNLRGNTPVEPWICGDRLKSTGSEMLIFGFKFRCLADVGLSNSREMHHLCMTMG